MNIKTSTKDSLGLHGLKQHKPWSDEERLGFLDQRKQAKMQWVQDPSQSKVDNLNNVRCEAGRHFRNKKDYLKAKIEELETNSKIKNIRDIYRCNDFAKGYQPRILVKDEKGAFIADYHSIMTRQGNHFSQLLNVHGVNDVRQTEIYTAETLVPEPSAFEFVMATVMLKRHKSPGTEQIPAKLIKAAGRTIHSEIHKLTCIISIWNKEELPEEWKGSINVSIYTNGNKTDCNNYRGIPLLPTT